MLGQIKLKDETVTAIVVKPPFVSSYPLTMTDYFCHAAAAQFDVALVHPGMRLDSLAY